MSSWQQPVTHVTMLSESNLAPRFGHEGVPSLRARHLGERRRTGCTRTNVTSLQLLHQPLHSGSRRTRWNTLVNERLGLSTQTSHVVFIVIVVCHRCTTENSLPTRLLRHRARARVGGEVSNVALLGLVLVVLCEDRESRPGQQLVDHGTRLAVLRLHVCERRRNIRARTVCTVSTRVLDVRRTSRSVRQQSWINTNSTRDRRSVTDKLRKLLLGDVLVFGTGVRNDLGFVHLLIDLQHIRRLHTLGTQQC